MLAADIIGAIEIPEWLWTVLSGAAGTLIVALLARYTAMADKRAAAVESELRLIREKLEAHERDDLMKHADLRVAIISSRSTLAEKE